MNGVVSIAGGSQEEAQNKGATARHLVSELGPYRKELLPALGLVASGAGAQVAGPWLIGHAIDEDILGRDPEGLFRTMLLLLVVYAVGALAQRGQSQLFAGTIGQGVLASFRARIFERLQHLPLGYFDRHPVGDLMSRVTNDVYTLNHLILGGLTVVPGSLFSLFGIMIAMLVLNARLAVVCFIIIPATLFITSFFAHRARQAFRATRETVGSVTADLEEEITGVREAQAFNRTEANIKRFRELSAANRAANVHAVTITSAFPPAIDALSTLGIAVVIGYGGYLVYAGSLSVGLLAAFLIYVQQFFRPIQLASQVYTQAQAALAGAERIYNILDEKPEPADPAGTIELDRAEGRIEFDNVCFAYEPRHLVLKDVSFAVEPGQTVALVGATGAGKTTIANLIPRFYDVTSGSVRVDGRDVREVSRKSLRAKIATVLQEPFLFSGTIAENIGYSRAGDETPATHEEIEKAARLAQAHNFISELPDGYDTVLGEGGSPLSQGQRQLLSFARAVLADPPILILDEATSNVDTRTEAIIQKALEKLLAARTSIVIAHRLSTVRNADQILVVEDGRIVESGTQASLLAAGGLYADLYRHQLREPVGSNPGD